MRKGIYILPNTLTLCGMFLGFYAILASLKGNYVHASWAIIFATVFDGLDGWVARLTHSTTRFGIELDSLSDLVAFGVAPAVMLYKWALAPFGRVDRPSPFCFSHAAPSGWRAITSRWALQNPRRLPACLSRQRQRSPQRL